MKLIKYILFITFLINFNVYSAATTKPANQSTTLVTYYFDSSIGSSAYFPTPLGACENWAKTIVNYISGSASVTGTPTTTSGVTCRANYSSGSTLRTSTVFAKSPISVITYSCSSGYFLSDSSGNASSTGQYCTTVPTQEDICKDKSSSNDYILGHGYFIGTSSSVMCSSGCQYSNSAQSISWTTLKYTDHANSVHECSVGVGAGSYFVATGGTCSTDGSFSNNYSTMQSAYNDCFKAVILADQQYKASQTTPVVSGSTPTYEGDGYSSDGNSLDCPYGQSSGQVNGETVSYCLSAPSTTTNTNTVSNGDGSTTKISETKTTKTNTDGSTTTTTVTTTTTTNPDGTSTTNTSTTSNTTGGSAGAGGSGGSGGGSSDQTDETTCSQDETGKVSCMDVGDTGTLNSDSLDSETKAVSYSVDGRFGSSGGTCPFGAFTFLGHTYNQFEVVCDGVVLFKAIFLTICSIAAAYIVFGFRGGEE